MCSNDLLDDLKGWQTMNEPTPDDVVEALQKFTAGLAAVEATNATIAEALREFAAVMESVHLDADALRVEMTSYRTAFEAVDRRTWRAALAGACAVLILAVAVTVSVVTSRRNAEIVETIRDCTQVGGRCYAEGQQRTAENVGQIVTVICDAVPPERRRPPCSAAPAPDVPTPSPGG